MRYTSQLILDLHRASHDVPFRYFQGHALGLMKQVINFDSAWWGIASINPNLVHRIHLHNCDGGLPYIEQNFFREVLLRNPGTTINLSDLMSRDAYVQTELYQAVGRHHKIEWVLGTLLLEPVSSLFEFITLWRHDPDKPFDEKERVMKELLTPHLVEAHRNSRLHHILEGGVIHGMAWAVADYRAYLHEVSSAFVSRIQAEWPEWAGSCLPEPLLNCLSDRCSFQGRNVVVEISPIEGFYFLEARSLRAFERLAPREREVAESYAQGRTYAEIAAALSLSPATVRNHIAHCFKKLGVTNKSELIHRVDHHMH